MVQALSLIIEVVLAFVCTGMLWFGSHIFRDFPDEDIYSCICGLLAGVFWWMASTSETIGVTSDGVTQSSPALAMVFLAIAAIVGIITIVKIITAAQDRKDEKNHIGNMELDMRL